MSTPRRRFLSTSLGAVGLAAAMPRGARADSYVLRLNIPSPSTSFHFAAFARFATTLARRSGGRLQIELYPNLQLATERESIDGMTSGVVDLFMSPTVFLQPLIPRLQAFDLPFIFKDVAGTFRVLDGPIGDEVFAELETKGILGLCWGGGGFREFGTTTRGISTPADMRGLRMRVQGGPIYAAMDQALAAIPVTIDYSEILVSLQQRTIDGIDLPFDGYASAKLYTVIQHIATSNHIFSVLPLIGGKKKIESMPLDLQRMLKEEGRNLRTYWRQLMTQSNLTAMQTLRDHGVTITQIDFAAFRKAMEPVYATFQPKIGTDWVQRIMRAAG